MKFGTPGFSNIISGCTGGHPSKDQQNLHVPCASHAQRPRLQGLQCRSCRWEVRAWHSANLHMSAVTQKYTLQSSPQLLRGKGSFSSLSLGKPRDQPFVHNWSLPSVALGKAWNIPKSADAYLKASSLAMKVCSPSCPTLSALPIHFLAPLTHTSFLPPKISLELWILNFSFHRIDPWTTFLSHLSQNVMP